MRALKTCLTLSLLCSLAMANEINELDSYISEDKIKLFNYDYEKNDEQSLQLRDSWISPVNLKYIYQKSNPSDIDTVSKTASITIDQSIFRFGGIYYGIKYAQASEKYGKYSISVAKQKLIKDAIGLLMQIKEVELKIKKQKLRIANADINLKIKQEQYLNGQLDSTFLDSAIIERNSIISALYDIETSKEKLISNFETISDINYKTVSIPTLASMKKDDFLNNNLVLDMSKSESDKDDFYKDMTIAKYLPSVNLIAGYNYSDVETSLVQSNDKYYNYGIRVSMPLDINTFRDVESTKVQYLQSKLNLKDKKRVMVSLYDTVMQNIANFDKKIELSFENKKIYEKLLEDTQKLNEVGYKTEYDVEILNNSLKIQDLDVEVLKIDKQLELLNLYETYQKSE